MANNSGTNALIDCAPLGALCAWALYKALFNANWEKSEQYWKRAIWIARVLGDKNPDGVMPALFDTYPDLQKAYHEGCAHAKTGRAYKDWYECDPADTVWWYSIYGAEIREGVNPASLDAEYPDIEELDNDTSYPDDEDGPADSALLMPSPYYYIDDSEFLTPSSMDADEAETAVSESDMPDGTTPSCIKAIEQNGDKHRNTFSESNMPHCTTPCCIEAIEKHGERHLVHACGSYRHPGWLPDAIAECERCGGHTNGTVWKHVCRICASEVPPGALQGLFVPHRCASCQARAEAEAEATNDRCRICRELRIRCCC